MQMRQLYKYLFAAVIFVFIFSGIMLAQNSNTFELQVVALNGYVRISWNNNPEVNVDHYEIWRSSGTSMPFWIGSTKCGVFYFDDTKTSLNKTEDQYFSYQVKVIDLTQLVQKQSETKGIHYTSPSSSYKSTWGSIKAMFR